MGRNSDRSRGGPWRRRSDDEAHASDEALAPIIDHPLVPTAEPELIDDEQAFNRFMDELETVDRFAYDTEFIGEFTYYPRICLVQIAAQDRVVLVDPLAGFPITRFWALVAAETPTKIVHAGMQDLEPPLRELDKPPRGVFDTQIAAGFCGVRFPVSLKDLVEEMCGGEIGRGLKFSQWDRRPLTPKQLRYAADDVRYLLLLHERLTDELEQRGRTKWAAEEFDGFADPSIYRTDPATRKLKVQGHNKMKARPRLALRELVIWRETIAQQRDISPRVLITDEALKLVAEAGVTEPRQLRGIEGLSKAVVRDLGDQIAEISRAVVEGPKPERSPKRARPTEAEDVAVDRAWAKLGEVCETEGVSRTLVTNRRRLADHVLRLVRGNEPKDTEMTSGWRELFVEPAIEVALLPPAEADTPEDQV